MKTKYDIKWLRERFDKEEKLKFLFFWGHTKNPNQKITNACFSQWYESPFQINGINYKTTEHWMMAQKALLFDNFNIYEQIILADKPGEAKDLGRKVTGFDESVWKNHRFQIVLTGNIHKFNQNRALGEQLLNTKNRIIVEASPVDIIWGIGLAKDSQEIENIYTWRGLNLLGFALMEARDFIMQYGFFKNEFSFTAPWITAPNTSPKDMFWRMGKGEEIMIDFSKNWGKLNEREKAIFSVSFPAPKAWKNFYD